MTNVKLAYFLHVFFSSPFQKTNNKKFFKTSSLVDFINIPERNKVVTKDNSNLLDTSSSTRCQQTWR